MAYQNSQALRATWGCPKFEGPYRGLYYKEILLFGGSILGVPYFRKPPHVNALNLGRTNTFAPARVFLLSHKSPCTANTQATSFAESCQQGCGKSLPTS